MGYENLCMCPCVRDQIVSVWRWAECDSVDVRLRVTCLHRLCGRKKRKKSKLSGHFGGDEQKQSLLAAGSVSLWVCTTRMDFFLCSGVFVCAFVRVCVCMCNEMQFLFDPCPQGFVINLFCCFILPLLFAVFPHPFEVNFVAGQHIRDRDKDFCCFSYAAEEN